MAILAQAWPKDLDPKRVPYQRRTITTLQRMGAWDDRTRFDELTIAEVARFWVTGPVTVADLVNTSQEAIAWHGDESQQLAAIVESETWTRQVWHRDRRFTDLLPRVDATVYDVAVGGHHDDQRHLYRTLPALRQRLEVLAAESRDAALIRYVSVNTGQSPPRTVALLQRLALLTPVISGSEAARQLSVSPQRIHQLVAQISYRLNQVLAPGVTEPWLPQQPDLTQHLIGTAPAAAER
jgi:hypothetical protein